MRAVVQRVSSASVVVNGGAPRTIGPGIVVLLGVCTTDTTSLCAKLAEKCAGLRIFDDADGKLNLSAVDLGYSALVVSNFTLYGDTKKGKRPSFTAAAKPPLSVNCYNEFVAQMQKQGLNQVQTGAFGADMQITLVNDGPVTLMLDTEEWGAAH
ncbi:D-tyrosyl-tRNA(Tyr) deacylase [Ruminococcaceae bacterium OttesenSCG-928-A16]|nr:D-tyrosyl-tRNA(Tyr) deacylase [Ruminococcaceae bacterium OttesenSCG-928-A16]